ncbi:MAG: DMT family transporter [Candidatus Carbobacillus altaicus]|nr:DMT family transporter [Candidatus Carbobacillus altaicus]
MVRAWIVVCLAVFFISTSAIWVRLSVSSPAVTAMYRLFFAVVFMLPYVHRKRAELLRSFRSLGRRDWFLLVLSGICLAVHFELWFLSLEFTSIASSVVLVTLQPLFTFVGVMLVFKERLRPLMWVGGTVAIIGAMMISWGDFALSARAFIGDMMALLAAFFISVYFMIGQGVRARLSVTGYTLVLYSVATIVLFFIVVLEGEKPFAATPVDWLYFIALATFPTLLGHTLLNWAIVWVKASSISVAILGEAVWAALLAFLVFGETLSLSQWTGGGLILLGIALSVRQTYEANR